MLILDDYENPVSAEDILGTSKEKDGGDDNGNGSSESSTPAKSKELKIPEQVQKEFDDFVAHYYLPEFESEIDDTKIDLPNLFLATRSPRPESEQGDYSWDRVFWRYEERRDEKGDPIPTAFSEQNKLSIKGDQEFLIKKTGPSPLVKLGIDLGSPSESVAILDKYPDYPGHFDISFSQVLDVETTIRVRYYDDTLETVDFHPIVKGLTSFVTERQDPEVLYNSTRFKFSQVDSTFSKVEGRSEEEFETWVEDTTMEDRPVKIISTAAEARFIIYNREEPEKVDYEITIPKKQEMVDFETGTAVERRYKWEEDLIPEALRKDPLQPPVRKVPGQPDVEVDESWKRGNLAETLGIKIQSTLAA